MAMNIVRRQPPQTQLANPVAGQWDPLRMFREFMRWDPFREMMPLQIETPLVFVPDVDVREASDAYIFKVDLPGVREQDLDVSLVGNRLIISGRREEEQRQEGDTYFAIERACGSFSRSFTLPEGTDPAAVKAELKEGVLTLAIPKSPEAQPKKIPVSAQGARLTAGEKGTSGEAGASGETGRSGHAGTRRASP